MWWAYSGLYPRDCSWQVNCGSPKSRFHVCPWSDGGSLHTCFLHLECQYYIWERFHCQHLSRGEGLFTIWTSWTPSYIVDEAYATPFPSRAQNVRAVCRVFCIWTWSNFQLSPVYSWKVFYDSVLNSKRWHVRFSPTVTGIYRGNGDTQEGKLLLCFLGIAQKTQGTPHRNHNIHIVPVSRLNW
jgi:hypothetical protein